jgi:hypothetical protein
MESLRGQISELQHKRELSQKTLDEMLQGLSLEAKI